MSRSASNEHQCLAKTYLQRPAEGLTVNGYRNWIAGHMTGNNAYGHAAHARFVKALGQYEGDLAHGALAHLMQNLGNCATCPLRCFAPETCHLAPDECALLGLVAAIQHGDDEAMSAALRALTCVTKAIHILEPAGEYALLMKASGSLLLPVPASVILAARAQNKPLEHQSNHTLH